MAERIGVCAKCGSKFKIPPTFKSDKAKCKKCGGVVQIPPAGEAAKAPPKAPAPAPKAKPKAAPKAAKKPVFPGGEVKKVAKPMTGVKKKSFAEKRASAGKGGRASRRKAAAGDDKKKMWIWIGGGGGAVILIVILILIFSGGDDEVTIPQGITQLAQSPRETETLDAGAGTPSTDAAQPEVEPADKPGEEPEDAAEGEEKEIVGKIVIPDDLENNPVIDYEPLPPLIGCSDERFQELTECFNEVYIKQELPMFRRRKLKKTIEDAEEEGFDLVPVYLNSFIGLDLLKRDHVALGFSIAQSWNKFSGYRFVDCNFKGDVNEDAMRANLKNNYVTIHSLVNLWRTKYSENEKEQQNFFEKVERHRELLKKKEAMDMEE
ncbi:MAG: hypothetical protein ACYTG7_07955, partial [Planctomycetota bacterium]